MNEIYVTINGVTLHCATAGPAAGLESEGPPSSVRAAAGKLMLFVHGFPEFWYAWKSQLREFAKDHLVVAPDCRGYNLSEKPAELEAYRVPVLIEDIRGLADHFRQGKKFVMVAHDWGGALAWAFAMAYPDYLEKLVIINAPHPAIFRALLENDPGQQAASQYMLLFRSPQAEAALSADNYALLAANILDPLVRNGTLTDDDKAEYLKAWAQPGALTAGLNYYRANRIGPPAPAGLEQQIGASVTDFGMDPAEMMVRVPTLVIWGEKDIALTVKNLDGLENYVPELIVKRVPEGTHWVAQEKPAEVNAMIRDFVDGRMRAQA
jgi:pimeloyl-ACP methyl ester carboxylesterase